jgi:predicted O-methyltransferase YrrM
MDRDSDIYSAVDLYIDELFAPADEALDAALKASADAGLPEIQVTPSQGKLLYLMARLCGAGRILEIGTLGGYSAIWLGRALGPGGRLITLELSPIHAAVARANLARAELTDRVEVVVGSALESLPALEARGEGPFDMVFIDADKTSYTEYLRWAVRLTRPGGLIVADNVVRGGRVLAPDGDAAAEGARDFNAALAAEPRLEATALQVVGRKGHDGIAIAIVKQRPES